MNERLARHFLLRLRNDAGKRAIEAALEVGILEEEHANSCGRVLGIFRRGAATPRGMSSTQITTLLKRHRRKLLGEYLHPVLGDGDLPVEENKTHETETNIDGSDRGSRTISPDSEADGFPRDELLHAVRAAAEPPRASEVATMLLIAQSLPNGERSHHDVLEVLRLRRPIITICSEARGFEDSFLDLLARGMILPGQVSRCNGYDLSRRGLFQFSHARDAKWQIITFAGTERERVFAGSRVGEAAQSGYPVVGVAELTERLPAKLVDAAQLNLSCGKLNEGIIRRTIEAVLGEPLSEKLHDIDFDQIEISDLAIAIRPGVSPSRAVATLRKFASSSDGESSTDDTADEKTTETRKTGSTSSNSSMRRGSDPGSGSNLIQPAKPSDGSADRIETLSGYGEAQEWALGLKQDLALWRAGAVRWEEMSTKILLAGPPGTGKTMFARALCNSLQIPLLATSVARWLEPAYLGDVLRRMKRAFTEAEANKPVVLFVDEIDGIGKRIDSSRDYSDYWNSVVNCLLELLDGATKTVGIVVVGATNNPSVIDSAVLRSGRLERHVEIPLPDTEALTGILRHHLRDDLEAIVASAAHSPPDRPSEADLQAIAKELGQLPDAVLRQLAASEVQPNPIQRNSG